MNSKTYCYIRISTDKQEYDRQIQIFTDKGYINNVNCEYIEETFTGTKTKRPKFNEMIKRMNKNDTLVVESLSRLSRGGIIKTLELITDLIQIKKVNVTIFKENFTLLAGEKPDASTNLLLGIFSVLGQFERDILSERTKEGIKATRAKGTKVGKPRTIWSSKENFIKTLNYMVTEKVGQARATLLCKYPSDTFKKDLKKLYEKYNTKDYQEILKNIKGDDDKWF